MSKSHRTTRRPLLLSIAFTVMTQSRFTLVRVRVSGISTFFQFAHEFCHVLTNRYEQLLVLQSQIHMIVYWSGDGAGRPAGGCWLFVSGSWVSGG